MRFIWPIRCLSFQLNELHNTNIWNSWWSDQKNMGHWFHTFLFHPSFGRSGKGLGKQLPLDLKINFRWKALWNWSLSQSFFVILPIFKLRHSVYYIPFLLVLQHFFRNELSPYFYLLLEPLDFLCLSYRLDLLFWL